MKFLVCCQEWEDEHFGSKYKEQSDSQIVMQGSHIVLDEHTTGGSSTANIFQPRPVVLSSSTPNNHFHTSHHSVSASAVVQPVSFGDHAPPPMPQRPNGLAITSFPVHVEESVVTIAPSSPPNNSIAASTNSIHGSSTSISAPYTHTVQIHLPHHNRMHSSVTVARGPPPPPPHQEMSPLAPPSTAVSTPRPVTITGSTSSVAAYSATNPDAASAPSSAVVTAPPSSSDHLPSNIPPAPPFPLFGVSSSVTKPMGNDRVNSFLDGKPLQEAAVQGQGTRHAPLSDGRSRTHHLSYDSDSVFIGPETSQEKAAFVVPVASAPSGLTPRFFAPPPPPPPPPPSLASVSSLGIEQVGAGASPKLLGPGNGKEMWGRYIQRFMWTLVRTEA